MLTPKFSLLTACLICTLTCQVRLVLSQTMPNRAETNVYPFITDLDEGGKYVLRWGFNESVIWFQVQVQTLGYVGFGISETGKMVPADVFVAYVTDNRKDNLAYFKDFHTVGYTHPDPDVSQDWFLDSADAIDGWTVLEFHRKLDTCDTVGDIPITNDTMQLIYAYSDQDPASIDSIMYHSKRGSKAVNLLLASSPPKFYPADVDTMDFLNENYKIPADGMPNFHCKLFDLSNITKKHHIIKVSPVLSDLTEHNVHHMVLYRCYVKNVTDLMSHGDSFNCFTDAPNHITFCREHVASFGHGKSPMYLPEDVGIPFGGAEEANFYVLATHYENEESFTNLIDNSGIRITYTAKLRDHDAAFLSLGNIISPNWLQFIPPGEPNFVQKAYCSMRCLGWGIGNCWNKKKSKSKQSKSSRGQKSGLIKSKPSRSTKSVPMTVVGVQFHSHSLGKAMKLRHFTRYRGNRAQENPWLAYDRSYDSEQQSFRLLSTRRKVNCRDELLLECTYDSSQRQRPTVGGWTEYDELCRGYMLYYPRKPIEGCMSWNNYDKLTSTDGHKINGINVFRTLVNTNWKDDRKMRNILRQTLDKSWENAQCWTSSPKREISYAIDFFRQPRITKIYKEPQSSTCQGV